MILAAATLWLRELIRFWRQPSRVIGALGSPFVFWLLIGSGIGTSFHGGNSPGARNYLEYFFPGTLLLVIFFTAVFSTISIIEDRREGFLQSVLVAPVPEASLVLGKVFGGTTLAFLQALFFLLLAPLIGLKLDVLVFMKTASVLFLNGFLLTSLGFLIAWQFHSIQGFHAVMNLFLMPLWILSGALFPAEGAAKWIRFIMKLNPLAYGLKAVRFALFGSPGPGDLLNSVIVTMLFASVFFIFASLSVAQPAHRRVG